MTKMARMEEVTGKNTSESRTVHGKRTRNGCGPCRDGKVKCDEDRPRCKRCVRLGYECDYSVRPRKKYTRQNKATAPSTSGAESASHSADLYCAPGSPTARIRSTSAESQSLAREDTKAQAPAGTDGHLDVSSTFEITNPGGSEIQVSQECAHVISPSDYAAINCFRSTVSVALDDTKNPEHSGPALSWTLAQQSPMVLHMVCALGDRKLRCQNSDAGSPDSMDHSSNAVEHYATALRLLAVNTQTASEPSDFDYILATIWLMIAYEHKHGDGCGQWLFAHLRGATSLLHEHLRCLRTTLTEDHYQITSYNNENCLASNKGRPTRISTLAARMIIWIAFIDGGAALHGLGGVFNEVLGSAMLDPADDPMIGSLRGFCALQRYSTLVYRDVWGPRYPQGQLIEDLQNSQIFCLHAELSHMRYLLATLADVDRSSSEESVRERHFICALRDIQTRYSELLAAANSPASSLQQAGGIFMANLRTVVPFYLAIILGFFRLTKGTADLHEGQRKALEHLLSLAFQAYRTEGIQAMARIAWPLFIGVLETGDMIQRHWILERFDSLATQGENYCRARNALRTAFGSLRPDEQRVNYWSLIRRSDIDTFVL